MNPLVIMGFYAVLFLVGLVGWVMNIVDIIAVDAWNGFAIVRCIGVFVAPLGAVLGYF